MNDIKKPPPPSLPPSTSKITDNFCLFHKGEIKGDIYQCVTCKAKYCMDCAKTAKSEGKKCVKCKQIIFVKNPS